MTPDCIYSLALGSSMANNDSATFRRWILPVAVFGISFTIQTWAASQQNLQGADNDRIAD